MSLEVINELLALLAHVGTGNEKAFQHNESQMMIKWPPENIERTGKENNKAELKALKDLDQILKEVKSGE